MLFGSQKPRGKTILLVDVESGSVGTALARISHDEPARLFGEHRVHLPVRSTRTPEALAREVTRAAEAAIAHTSEVAARLRRNAETAPLGYIEKGAFIFSAPWGMPNLTEGRPTFVVSIARALRNIFRAHAGEAPVSLNTHAAAMLRGMQALLTTPGLSLVCSVHGEVVELLVLQDGKVVGHATIPTGAHSLIRTLRTHSGLSEHEARSALFLREHPHLAAPLTAYIRELHEKFREAGEPLFGGLPVQRVYIFARGPEAHWFARALSHSALSDLFPGGGTVQVLTPTHLASFVEAHAPKPDGALLLNTLLL